MRQIRRAALFSWLSNLALQAFRVPEHIPRNDLAFSKLKDGNALIGDFLICTGKTKQFSSMSARVREPGDDSIALADELINVIVKIGKRGADFVHVLFELFDAIHGGSNRAAEDDAGREEFFDSCRAPLIPELRVVSADQ